MTSQLQLNRWNGFTTVLAGAEEIKFTVHTHILRKAEWFRKCLDAGMKESLDNTIRLPEDDPAAVSELISWLYGGKLDLDISETCCEVGFDYPVDADDSYKAVRDQYEQATIVLTSLYFLAKKLCIEKIQNMVIDQLLTALTSAYLAPKCYEMVCRHDTPKDGLHRLISQDLAWHAQRSTPDEWNTFKQDHPLFQQFALKRVEHMQFIMEAVLANPEADMVSDGDSSCTWHTHDNTPKCSE